MIVKRIEHDLDRVIIEYIFPARQTSPDLAGLRIEGNKDCVQILGVVSKVDVGTLGRWSAVSRNALNEPTYGG